MPKRETRPDANKLAAAYDLEQKNALTRKESRELLGHIHAALTDNGSTTLPAAFLLLLNSIVFEDDDRERFVVWCDARSMFALDIEGPYYALEASLGEALTGMRTGGAK
jgi:hypothetical protein